MEIINLVWTYYLYIPLFNFLIFLYNNYSGYNFGLAVIILTVILRIILLPLSILTEQSKIITAQLRKEVKVIEKDFASDPVQKKLVVRRLLKKKKIRPWAKALALAVQGLILVILYQVFLGGINTEAKLHLIYPGIVSPDFITTKFLWFDVGQRDFFISFLVGVYLFASIRLEHWHREYKLSKKQQIFNLFFPVFCFLALYLLPSVKSIFILTSLIFSSIISLVTIIIQISLKKAQMAKN